MEMRQAFWQNQSLRGLLIIAILLASAIPCPAEESPSSAENSAAQSALAPGVSTALTLFRQALPDAVVEWTRPGPLELTVAKIGGLIVYLDASGRYLISGAIFDLQEGRNLTQELYGQEAAALVFTKDLDQIAIPLGHARSPEQELAIFDDVDCPFCQKEHQELLKLLDEGWRVWVLLYPVESLHPHAKSKSISVWCAQDRQAALLTLWKTQQRPPDAVCHDPLARIKQLALRIPVTGTPTLVWKRGLVRNGFITAEEIKRLATQTSDGASTTLSKP